MDFMVNKKSQNETDVNNGAQTPVGLQPNFSSQKAVTDTNTSKPKTDSGKNKFMMPLVVFVILILAGGTAYLYMQYNQAKEDTKKAQAEAKRLSDPVQVAKTEQDQLLAKIGQIVELPKNETPTIATVSDITKLKDQPFFADAQNGDKVLIYPQKAKKAYLYRPSTDKIIQIAPVNIGANEKNNSTTKP